MEGYVLVDNGRLTEKEARLNMEQCADFLARMIQKYTRVSTAAQTEGYSLDAQKERLRQFAEYKDLEIAGEYCDAGKSGHSIKGRPSFMEMLDDITAEKDDISFVLVYKLWKECGGRT